MNMERVKPFKSLEEQVEILKSRGLIIEDTQFAISTLKYINYYRLSAYSLTLRSNDKFTECATFENVMQLYNFDGDLRNCLMKYCSAEQSKALAAAMNAAYDRQPETEPTDDDNTDEDNDE